MSFELSTRGIEWTTIIISIINKEVERLGLERIAKIKGQIKRGSYGDFILFTGKNFSMMKNYCAELFPGMYAILADYNDMDYYDDENLEKLDYYGISYCLEGRYEWRKHNKRAFYFKNTLTISTMDQEARGVVFPMKKLRSITYIIDKNSLKKETKDLLKKMDLDLDLIFKDYTSTDITMIRDHPKVISIFSRFYSEFFNKGLHQIKCLEILRFLQDEKPKQEQMKYITSSQAQKMNEIEKYMCKHLDQKLSIHELCEQFEISSTSLKEHFKEVYGQPIHAYLIDRKMEEGERLLLETDLTILEISGRIGYSAPGKFSTTFKKKYGFLPTEFRRRRRSYGYL